MRMVDPTSARRPHVVILDENLPVPLDRRVWLEAQTLSANGYQVTVIAPRGRGAMRALGETRDGIRIGRYPQRAASGIAGYVVEYPPSLAFSLLWLLRLRAQGPIDVIHGSNPPDLFFLLGIVGRAWGAKYVYDQHDANPELSRSKWGHRRLGRLLLWLTERLEAASYRSAALVIVPNDSYARIAAERGSVSADRLVVVRNAPPAGRFRELAGAIRPAGDGTFRIGYLGVMGSQDGVEILVQAIADLRARLPSRPIRADLVGDGEARPALEELARAVGVADIVTFHGYQQAEAFVPILAAAHVCVSPDPPDPFNDVSTMTKVVEYLAIGRPVVSFDLAETRVLVGDAGVIVEDPTSRGLASALALLAEDSLRLRELEVSAATRFAALDLDWEGSAGRLLAGYARIAPAARPTRTIS
jgi:glycosyltransferase involved in cell wall biosynthesis